MKKIIKKWLGIDDLENLVIKEGHHLQSEINKIDKKFEIDPGMTPTRNINSAVQQIMRHLKLGWQTQITEELPEVRASVRTSKDIIRPIKEIEHQILLIKKDSKE